MLPKPPSSSILNNPGRASAYFRHFCCRLFALAATQSAFKPKELGRKYHRSSRGEMEDDDWGLSMEELDSLEKDAFRKLSGRQESSSTTASGHSSQAKRVIPSSIASSPSKNLCGQVTVKIFKDRPGRIAVETQYNKHLVAMLKSVAGHEWDQHRRVWTYPEGQLENVAKMLTSLPQIVASIHAVPPLILPSVCLAGDYNSALASLEESSPAKLRFSQHHGCSTLSPCKQLATSKGLTIASPQAQKNGIVVQIYLTGQDRIAARSSYNERVKEACQSVQGRLWNPEEKVWTFPRDALEELVDSLVNISSLSVTVEPVPPLVLPKAGTSETSGAPANRRLFESDIQSSISSSASTTLWQEVDHGQSYPQEDDVKKKLQKYTVKFFLHASGNIAAKFDYQTQLVVAFRTIPKAEWHAKERLWMFPVSSLAEAERTLADIKDLMVDVETLDPLVRRALEAAAALPNLQGMYNKMLSSLEAELLPFQRAGVRFVLEHGGRALIADEMGLGKTLQAIAVASCLQDCWPVLVITPSALRLQWALMIQQWLKINASEISVVMSQWAGSNRSGFNVLQSSGKQAVHLDGVFNILSYDLVSKLQDTLVNTDFKIVIADESHFLKNAQAKRTNACVPLLQKARYAILLTGTPALSRPIELFKQLEALYPTVYKNVHQYGQRYCKGGFFGLYQGASNHEELHALMKTTVMIRRLKKDVLSELPVKRRQQVFLSLEDREMTQMRALFYELGTIQKSIKACTSDEQAQALKYSEKQLINKIYTDSAEAKIPAVLDYLGTMIEAGCKFLVFAHHLSMLDAIQQLFVKKKVGHIRIDGSTPTAVRQALVTQFQDKEDIKAAVLAIRAAGLGLTLTAASTVIFAELSWTPGDIVQAEDRAHRIGQVSSVNVYYLHANDTVDDIIWDAVHHKLENLGQMLDGREEALEASSSQHHTLSKGQTTLNSFLQSCTNNYSNIKSTDSEGDEHFNFNGVDSGVHRPKKVKK